MNHFLVNGVERPSPVGADANFGALIGYVHDKMTSDRSLVSSIRVDGVEIGQAEENSLSGVSLSDLESVEITFAHPRELAEETLQILRGFADRLAEMSRELAAAPFAQAEFTKLVDGIQTFTESLAQVKGILRIGILEPVNVLEADLVSILKDVLETLQTGDGAYRADLLREHLPKNLGEWAREGIPALIRSRDS
jgi:hypothetical protein